MWRCLRLPTGMEFASKPANWPSGNGRRRTSWGRVNGDGPSVGSPGESAKRSADELIQMAVLGIDARYRQDIAEAGYPGLSTNELQQFKIHGVKGSWLRGLAAQGYAGLSAKQVTNMAIHDVSGDFARRVNQ